MGFIRYIKVLDDVNIVNRDGNKNGETQKPDGLISA